MFALRRSIPAGILAGYLADVLVADPRRGHPVAGFGWCATALENVTYRDNRGAGTLHTALLVGGITAAGALARRHAGGGVALALLTAAATWSALGGTTLAALRAWWRDADRHPSPNAGVVEASFAGALGVRLGGPTQYRHELEIRPTLGDGRTPEIDDLRRAVRLSRAVQATAAILAVMVSAVGPRAGDQRRRP